MKSRADAQKLLEGWVSSESLRKHCLGVAVCMESYAKKYLKEGKIDNKEYDNNSSKNELDNNLININNKSDGSSIDGRDLGNNSEDGGVSCDRQAIIDKWYICGLLHDFDWEKNPTLEEHPIKGCQELRKLECDEDIIEAILGHNKATGIPRRSLMAKTLFAVDELSGLVIALARVRPGNFEGMNAKSVKKTMKKKDFAVAINRQDVKQGMGELGFAEDDVVARDAHLELVIGALEKHKNELGF